jgi:hypothetical protein
MIDAFPSSSVKRLLLSGEGLALCSRSPPPTLLAQQGGGDGPGSRLIRVPPGNLAPWPGRARGGAPAGKVQGNGHQGLDDGALAGKA